MHATKALLVDFDGTLLSTGRSNYEAYSAALSEIGISVDREQFDDITSGKHWKQFLPELLPDRDGLRDPVDIWRRKSDIYKTKLYLMSVNCALVDLIGLMRATLRTGLVTTASSANAFAALDHLNLRSMFDVIVTGDDVRRHKPYPDAYELAAQKLGVTAAECLVVEDSDVGIASATTFGARVLSVRTI